MKNTFSIPTIVGGKGSNGSSGSSSGVSSVNGRTGSVVLSKSDVGLENYDSDIALLEGQIGANRDDIQTLQTELQDINAVLDNVATADTIDSKIVAHNLNNQSHNDIRNSIVNKAEKVENTSNKNGNIAIVDANGQYQVSDTHLEKDINNSISAINANIGALTGDVNDLKNNAAIKNDTNTFTSINTFNGDVNLGAIAYLTSNDSKLVNGINSKAILATKAIDSNTQSTYIGGDQVEIYAPDAMSIESANVKIKRNNITYTNIDSGNINDYVTGGVNATIVDNTYGIRADYQNHYGIVDVFGDDLISSSPDHKEITVNAGITLRVPGANPETRELMPMIVNFTTTMKHTVTTTGTFVLFYVKEDAGTMLREVTEDNIYWSTEEPPLNGKVRQYWWNPNERIWQTRSDAEGNIWLKYQAQPFATIKASETGINSINYVGYRIINDDIFAQLSAIGDLNDNIADVNKTANDALTQSTALDNYIRTEVNQEIIKKAPLDSNQKVPLANLPYKAGNNITITEDGTISAPNINDLDTQIINGDKVQISYTHEASGEEVSNDLNSYCQAVDHDLYTLIDLIEGSCVTLDKVQTISGNKTFSKTIVANGGVRMAVGQALTAGSDTLVQMIDNFNANGIATDSVIVGAQGSNDRLILQAAAGILHKRGNLYFEVLDTGNITEYAQPKIATYTRTELPDPLSNAGTFAICSDLNNALVFCDGSSWKKVPLEDLPEV
ncbi:MAG: hypothetical protein NC222_06135 [Staphylococcus sp.]|nr:hypothetical protein [Staphylococcus sp.]